MATNTASGANLGVYGQESNHTRWRLAKMNLAIRDIDANLAHEHADNFHRDHPPGPQGRLRPG